MALAKRLLLVFISVVLIGCNPSTETATFNIQGHRGARGLAPENSIDGFLLALNWGVETLEMDVVVTGDGQVVLSHEPYLSSAICATEGGQDDRSYNIYKMTLQELQSYYCGSFPHADFPEQIPSAHVKPTLSTVIQAVQNYCDSTQRSLPDFNIEIKSKRSTDLMYHPGPAEFVQSVMTVVTEAGIAERTIIQSFDPRPLRLINGQYPEIRTAYLTARKSDAESYRSVLGFAPHYLSPEYSILDTAVINAAHRDSVQVVPWTVNDLNEAQKLYKWGVDGLITDYPDRITAETIKQPGA